MTWNIFFKFKVSSCSWLALLNFPPFLGVWNITLTWYFLPLHSLMCICQHYLHQIYEPISVPHLNLMYYLFLKQGISPLQNLVCVTSTSTHYSLLTANDHFCWLKNCSRVRITYSLTNSLCYLIGHVLQYNMVTITVVEYLQIVYSQIKNPYYLFMIYNIIWWWLL